MPGQVQRTTEYWQGRRSQLHGARTEGLRGRSQILDTDRRIGVALSGGGYRAAAWGLGALMYLTDAQLRTSVVTASSVSGGSIANAGLGLAGYRAMTPEELWAYAAELGPRLAGNFNGFLAVLAAHVLAWATATVGAANHRPVLAWIALGVAVVLSLLVPRTRPIRAVHAGQALSMVPILSG